MDVNFFNKLAEGKDAYIGGLMVSRTSDEPGLETIITDINFSEDDEELLVEGESFDANVDEYRKCDKVENENGVITIYIGDQKVILHPNTQEPA